jgi:hypothetical protein
MKMHPQEDNAAQITESVHPKKLDVKQIEQPKAMFKNPAEKKELTQLVTLPKPETTKNNSKTLEYATTRKTIIQVASREQVDLPEEIAARSKSG